MSLASAAPTIASLNGGPNQLAHVDPGAACPTPPVPATLARFGERLVRHRVAFFLVVAALFVSAFNGQWRIALVWRDDGAHAVEIVDYH